MLGVGKRKTAVAIASIKKGKGRVKINSAPLEFYEPELHRMRIQEALALAGALSASVDVDINVRGGGISCQSDAIRTAIGSGLVKFSKNEELKRKFKEHDRSLIVSDMRQCERKKPGGRGARGKVQKSYR